MIVRDDEEGGPLLIREFFVLIATLLVIGCTQEELLQKFSTPEDQQTARAYIDRLRAHDFDPIEQAMDPSLRSADLRRTLERMAGLIPNEKERSVKLVGAQKYLTPDTVTVNTSFEYSFQDKWMLANVAVRTAGGKRTIVGFNVYPEARSLEETNRFTLGGRGAAQYAVLVGAITAVVLSVYALVACVRTRTAGRKWPWVIFILLGFGQLAVNWTTGQLSFIALHVSLLSASAAAPLYGPWTIAVSLPVGAIAFLTFGRRRLAAHAPQAPA